MGKRILTKADFILAIILLIIGIGSPFLFANNPSENAKVIITIDGEEAGSYKLSENETLYIITAEDLPEAHRDKAYLIFTEMELLSMDYNYSEYISNAVKIEEGRVCVTQASCHGQDCVNTGEISKEGQIIACLPHKLMISIVNPSEQDEVDAVIY